ncbi:hypothetical protein T12_12295 [Trichinella patagoniensis]|uniref:Uncharacterized protein n=1 Tax=Trichinella patagoniensis TaxID=990121 RepID=A0A0V1A481_9BILA|nr:hypothetical protein T12_12295 [Trichinella patagoniensis]
MSKPGYQTDHAQGVGDRFGSQEAYCGSGSQKTMPIDKQICRISGNTACSKFCQNRSALFVIAIMVIKDAQMVHYETREAANYVTYTNAGRHLLTFREPLDRYIGPLHTQMVKHESIKSSF